MPGMAWVEGQGRIRRSISHESTQNRIRDSQRTDTGRESGDALMRQPVLHKPGPPRGRNANGKHTRRAHQGKNEIEHGEKQTAASSKMRDRRKNAIQMPELEVFLPALRKEKKTT